ncbi:hypothetical protein QGP82_22235 [Leptothoe sp. LEGE 181152]|nr:hypothetical protein [Leptothoe sp. LEGE 181152]
MLGCDRNLATTKISYTAHRYASDGRWLLRYFVGAVATTATPQ